MSVRRFLVMQKKYFPVALKEIQRGRKNTHWIWFIFPQLRGLGQSSMSFYYGLDGVNETRRYFRNKMLRNNLLTITNALYNLKTFSITEVVGNVDAVKIQACMTLFYVVTKEPIFKKVLKKFFHNQFHEKTLLMCQNIF